MRITTKLLLLGMVGMAAAPFILKKPDGTPWLSLSEITASANRTVNDVKESIPGTASKPQEMFKWQDAQGNWHFSDKPSGKYNSNKVQLDAAYNQMKHVELPDGFGAKSSDEEEKFDPTKGKSSLPITTAPLEKVPEMLQEIEKVQDKMEQRQKMLDGL